MGNGKPADDASKRTELKRRQLLGLAGAGGLTLLAGCGQGAGSKVSISENDSLVVSDVQTINLGDGVTVVESTENSVSIGLSIGESSADNLDAVFGAVAVDSLHLSNGQEITLGNDDQVTARYDSSTGRLEVKGAVRFSGGTFKGPYDTNNFVHDMLLPGMHAYATDAVGVQDNVLGFADEWAEVTNTPISDSGSISNVFKPGPSGWIGWNRFEDYPVQVTVEGLDEDWGPGRGMVMFRPDMHAGRITLETRSGDDAWEQVAEKRGNEDSVVVLDPEDATTPVTAIRWTFAAPGDDDTVRVSGLFYYSMSIKGNTWLPKARGETTNLTLLPQSVPDAPDEGATIFVDQSSGQLRAKHANGTESTLPAESQSTETSGTVTLSDGSAVVETGITDAGRHLDVYLDPTGDGTNRSSVSVSSTVEWNDSRGEYCVRIREDETDVGDPTIGYRIKNA
jgi:hypothetical protein